MKIIRIASAALALALAAGPALAQTAACPDCSHHGATKKAAAEAKAPEVHHGHHQGHSEGHAHHSAPSGAEPVAVQIATRALAAASAVAQSIVPAEDCCCDEACGPEGRGASLDAKRPAA